MTITTAPLTGLTRHRPPQTTTSTLLASLTWGGYARISEDPNDERTGVTRQVEDITDAILGFNALPPDPDDEARMLVENDTGAFLKRKVQITDHYGDSYDVWRVIRPKWAAALRDLRAGRINALMVYDLDRLARDPRDLEDAIEVVEHYGAVIKSATASEIDLMTESGRLTARIMVTVANKSSADTSRRVKRAHLQLARSGVVKHGGRPFGWKADKIALEPKEAALIRKAAADVIDGKGLRAIVREWNEAGVKTARGNDWDHRAVRQLLKGPRLAGWRVHQGKIATDDAGQPVKGIWKSILDQDTFDRLQATVGRNSTGAKGGRRGARKYLLSGVARCGVCGAAMYGSASTTGFNYTCRKDGTGIAGAHQTTISGVFTDLAVSGVVMARLGEEQLDAPEPAPFPASDRLAEIPGKISELMAAFNKGELSGTVVFPQVKALETEQAELGAARDRYITQTSGPDLTQVDPEQYETADLDRQRAIVEGLLEAVVIAPAKARGARWTEDRITYVWKRP